MRYLKWEFHTMNVVLLLTLLFWVPSLYSQVDQQIVSEADSLNILADGTHIESDVIIPYDNNHVLPQDTNTAEDQHLKTGSKEPTYTDQKEENNFIVDIGIGASISAYGLNSSDEPAEDPTFENPNGTAGSEKLDIYDIAVIADKPYSINVYALINRIIGVKVEYWRYTTKLNSAMLSSMLGVSDYLIHNESIFYGIILGYTKAYENVELYPNIYIGLSNTYRTDEVVLEPGYFYNDTGKNYLKDQSGFFVMVGLSTKIKRIVSLDLEVGVDYRKLKFENEAMNNALGKYLGSDGGIFARAGLSLFFRIGNN